MSSSALQRFAFVDERHFSLPMPRVGVRLSFVIRVRSALSDDDCRQETEAAKRLRHDFRSCVAADAATGLGWTEAWPGSTGTKGLSFDVPAHRLPVTKLGQLLTVDRGAWKDPQYYADDGLLAFAVTQEQAVALREDFLEGLTHGQLAADPGQRVVPVSPVVAAYLTGR